MNNVGKAIVKYSDKLLTQALGIREDIEIGGIEYDPFSGIVSLLVRGPGLPYVSEGSRPELISCDCDVISANIYSAANTTFKVVKRHCDFAEAVQAIRKGAYATIMDRSSIYALDEYGAMSAISKLSGSPHLGDICFRKEEITSKDWTIMCPISQQEINL